MPTALYSNPPLADFILSEAQGQRSRDNIMVNQTGAAVPSGTVLSVKTAGVGEFLHNPAATGNSTVGAIVIGAAAKFGTYLGTFTSATVAALTDPSGAVVGNVTLGVAFNTGGVGFTLTAGATAHVVGDEFSIDVTPAALTYAAAIGADSQDAILYSALPAQTGSFEAVGFTADCEVKRTALLGLSAAGEITLAARGIKVRGRQGIPGISTPAL